MDYINVKGYLLLLLVVAIVVVLLLLFNLSAPGEDITAVITRIPSRNFTYFMNVLLSQIKF